MLSSILNNETKEEFKNVVDVLVFPVKIYCILLLLFILVLIFELYILINLKKSKIIS